MYTLFVQKMSLMHAFPVHITNYLINQYMQKLSVKINMQEVLWYSDGLNLLH